MELSGHIAELVEVMYSDECVTKNQLIALLEIKKNQIIKELLEE
jgi:hypothetical protein